MTNQRDGIFLCYRRQDSEDFSSRLFDELARYFGRDHVFKDVDSLLPGLDWQEHLNERLSRAAVAIVVIGEEWMDCQDRDGRRRLDTADDHVCHEVTRVLEEKIPVIPLLIGSTPMPESGQLPPAMRALVRRQNFAIRRDQHFRNDSRLLIENLERLLEARAPAVPAAVPQVTDPAYDRRHEVLPSDASLVRPPVEPTGVPLRGSAPVVPPIPAVPIGPAPAVIPGAWTKNLLLFALAWALTILMLPLPWVGARCQQWLLQARGIPASGWAAQISWAAPMAILATILLALHMEGEFGGATWDNNSPWGEERAGLGSSGSGTSIRVWNKDKNPSGSYCDSGVYYTRFAADPEDRFLFGLMAAAPLIALLGLQWNLLRGSLRFAWLWFLPPAAMLILCPALPSRGPRLDLAIGTIISVMALHTVYQALLMPFLLKKTA